MTATLQEALKAQGADRLDPMAWHYIQVLAQRTQKQQGPAQKLLFAKLEQALTRLQAKLNAAQQVAGQDKAETEAEAQVRAEQGATAHNIGKPCASPLAALLQDMRPAPTETRTVDGKNGTTRPELPTVWQAENPKIKQFKKQLRQISVQKQVSSALAQAPQNAGPINSHMLVLRSLGLMREASPDYLNRFMGYVDTLLWLEVAESVKPAGGKKKAAGTGTGVVSLRGGKK